MSITWGGVEGHLRAGINYATSQTSDTFTITAIYYWQSVAWGYGAYTGTIVTGGSMPATRTFSASSAYSQTKTAEVFRHSKTFTRTSSNQTATLSCTLSGSYDGATPSVARTVTIPAKSSSGLSKPAAPTGVSAARISDGKATVSWTLHDSSSAPVDAVAVDRWSSNSDWARVATIHDPGSSWTDTSLKPDRRYQYRVRAGNGAGDSAWVLSGFIATTPAAPTGVQASRNADGSVTLTWTNTAQYQSGVVITRDGVQVGTGTASATSWTDTSPAGGSITYGVQASADGVLSAVAASNTVTVQSPPSAPANLSPNGGTVPAGTVTLGWQHSPADSSSQTRAEVRVRPSGGAWGSVLTVTDVTPSVDVDLTQGVFEWQVRTWGAYQSGLEEGASPWSAIAAFTVADAPTVGINTPESGSVVTSSRILAEWGYAQAQDRAQTSAQVRLLDATGTVLEDRTIQGAALSLPLTTTAINAATYTLQVRARSSDGLWSEWDQATFTVDYPEPLAPQVGVSWDDAQGVAVIQVTNTDPGTLQVLQVLIDADTGRPYAVEA